MELKFNYKILTLFISMFFISISIYFLVKEIIVDELVKMFGFYIPISFFLRMIILGIINLIKIAHWIKNDYSMTEIIRDKNSSIMNNISISLSSKSKSRYCKSLFNTNNDIKVFSISFFNFSNSSYIDHF